MFWLRLIATPLRAPIRGKQLYLTQADQASALRVRFVLRATGRKRIGGPVAIAPFGRGATSVRRSAGSSGAGLLRGVQQPRQSSETGVLASAPFSARGILSPKWKEGR